MSTATESEALPRHYGGRDVSGDELVTASIELYRAACRVRKLAQSRETATRIDVRKAAARVALEASQACLGAIDSIEDVMRAGGPLPVRWADDLEVYTIPSTPRGLCVTLVGTPERRSDLK
jgi:hypothetical protein